jgi:DNA-binding NtrC family response regulator
VVDNEPSPLACLLVVDPDQGMADHIAGQMRRVFSECITTTTSEQALSLVEEIKPQMVVLSLEINWAENLAARWTKQQPQMFVVVTYREMPSTAMKALARAGVKEVMSQPIDFAALYRAVSQRFNIQVRRHVRLGRPRLGGHLTSESAQGVQHGKEETEVHEGIQG